MSLKIEDIKFLENIDNNCVHGKKILKNKSSKEIKKFYDKYCLFYKKMEEKDIEKKITEFKKYKKFVHKNNRKKKNNKLIFSAQSKFEPSILEEFLFHLFKDIINQNETIKVGKAKVYSNLYFAPSNFRDFKNRNFIRINSKNQDFSIYKKVILNDNNEQYELLVPIIAIECKTYLDKTMLEGSIATAEKIKSGNPHCKFFIVTETYGVDFNVDPSTSRIDNIFVLKKGGSREDEFYEDVFKKLYDAVARHLKSSWSNIKKNIEQNGVLY